MVAGAAGTSPCPPPRPFRCADHRLSPHPRRKRRLARSRAGSLRYDAGAETLHGGVAAASGRNARAAQGKCAGRTRRSPFEPQHPVGRGKTIPAMRWESHFLATSRTGVRRSNYFSGKRPALRGRRFARAEDRLFPRPAREPQAAQALLQFGHVVAPQHGGAPEEEAVTEAKTGLDQGVPRLLTADAVDPEAPKMLEGLYGGPG